MSRRTEMEYHSNENGLIVDVSGCVMKITHNRPHLKNGGDWRSLRETGKAYQLAIDNPEEIRCIVIAGSNGYWNTGGRVLSDDPEERRNYADAIKESMEVKKKLRQPIIAAVNGDCLKGGMGLLVSADLAVAVDTAKFGLPEMRMGGVPMVVMAQIMSIPKKLLLEACYSSEYFDAQTAYRMGLVNAVVSEEEFWPTVERYVRMITDNSPALVQMTHDAYYELAKVFDDDERAALAQKLLKEKVLPQMAKEKTTYNV